ncbi:hypothetical protein ABB37_08267 [Leptomonas pyrrhocoris]|uniref:Uncharacterized protein n=1 Tax=Leptomonas pyrrhocoris TaxID=157538 RepID=A0A0N0DSA7_LEPPY|nr:hypothetical protein ABB37_08267 [Leptomonas pyrrhocoris]XP_015654154.1 hypothetical protein ABB37_08267 [Leptomonas pyrrhocoris]XP_015654155.1 hypothetical protein ABB37_08267 [Leptomonas pyrrhocoris]XP_015654156.1 hypothetical protein ABB37_08267 [Leptomonas pyrrhocoris]KPA75714.1 hypothetical protein ABB37_08267 [Leptomonas pyrrhocoris]KPA75715.1 hypothetical protein ABB37_08267 [Leptomonas pyrrhocoris]KPA75716.1 hypothetical protein ABB37_08267 [Leptomonas pyrrhocoris]KPA75717.1 hypot|eukprot:XP_015654153.1 hypothetical protein ABB37_08267 [Leptomonas pyrrhocoris]
MVSISPKLNVSATNFNEYRAYYLATRSSMWTRRSHVLATTLAALAAVFAAIRLDARLMASSIAVGYLLCWGADAAFERRRPASLEHPIWAFRANLCLVKDVMAGNQPV